MSKEAHIFRNIIGGSILGSFIGAMVALFLVPIPGVNETLITYMLGQLSGFAGAVVAFHYSTTAGSQHARELLARSGETATGKADDPLHVEGEMK
jgi:hypothetical protein